MKAEVQKSWVRFLLARESGCRIWILKNFRFLCKCPKKFSEGECDSSLRTLSGRSQIGHLTFQGPGILGARMPRGNSLSECSEGDITISHTMEEILEESEI